MRVHETDDQSAERTAGQHYGRSKNDQGRKHQSGRIIPGERQNAEHDGGQSGENLNAR